MTDLKDLEESWREDPNNLKTFFALEAFYKKSGDWAGLIRIYSSGPETIRETKDFGTRVIDCLGEVSDAKEVGEDRARLLVALGDAELRHRSDRDAAMKYYQTAHKEYPNDVTCLERARDMYFAIEDYDRVLLLFRLQGKVFGEPNRDRFETLVGLAQIHGDFKGRFDDALPFIKEALEIFPDDKFAKELLTNYKSETSLQTNLRQTISEAELAVEENDYETAAEWFRIAAELEELREGGCVHQAAEYAERGLGYDPSNEDLGALLGDLVEKRRRIDARTGGRVKYMNANIDQADALDGYPDLPGVVGNSTQKLDVSELLKMQAADRDKKLQADAAKWGVSEAVQESEAVEEREAVEKSDAAEESEVVEKSDAAEEREAVAESKAVEEVQISAAKESKVVETNNDADANLDSFQGCLQILSKTPNDLEAIDHLREYAEAETRWEGYLDQLERTLKRIRKHERELELMVDGGVVAWQHLNDFERAEYHFKRVKLIDREHPQMLAFYEALFQENEEWSKLFPILTASVTKTDDPNERRERQLRASDIAENKMGSPEKAIEIWRSALKLDGEDDVASEEITRLFRQSKKWTQLIDVLRNKAAATVDTEGKVEILLEVAAVYENDLQRDANVASTLDEILTLDPERDDVFERLVRLYEKQKNITHLVSLTKNRAEQKRESGDIESALTLKFKAAELLSDSLKNVSAAIPVYESILDIEPTNREAIEKLKMIYEKRRDFDSLFSLEKREVYALEDDDERVEALKKLVNLSLDKMKNFDEAEPLLEQILEVDPFDLEALGQLEGVKRKKKEYGELAEILVRKAAAYDDSSIELQIAALGEAGDLYKTKNDDLERACSLWKEVLVLDDNNSKAIAYLTDAYIRTANFDALDQLYRERNDLDRLYDLLDSAADTSSELVMKTILYRRMAVLAEEQLHSPERVISSLESLRKISNRPEIIAEELIGWYSKTDDFHKEIEMHVMILDVMEAADEDETEKAFEHQTRLCELENARENFDSALRWSIAAMRTDPTHLDNRILAEELAEKNNSVETLIAGLDEAAELTFDQDTKESIWLRIGELHSNRGEVANAIERFEAVRSNRPDDKLILKSLERLYTESGEWERKVEILHSQIEANADEEDKVEDFRAQIASLQLSQLGSKAEARNTFLEILQSNPEHIGALQGLIEISRAEQAWGDMIQYSLTEIENSNDPDRIRHLQMSMGNVHQFERDEPFEAVSYYSAVLETHEGDVAAIGCLEELLKSPSATYAAALIIEPVFRDSGESSRLANALEARNSVDLSDAESLEILDELINLYMGPLDDPSMAFERVIESMTFEPHSELRHEKIETLAGTLGRWEDVDSVYSEYAAQDISADPSEVLLLRRLADIRENKLGNANSTIEALSLLVDIDPADDAAYAGLERINRTTLKHDALVDVLIARSKIAEMDATRIDFLIDAATICDDVLADSDRTILLYRQILEIDGTHEHAIDHLRELLRAGEKYDDLSEFLESCALETSDEKRRRSISLELANLNTYQRKDYDRSLELLRDLVAENASDVDAIRELEFLNEAIGADNPAISLEVANLVEPAYRNSDDHRKLIQVLESRVESTSDVFAKVDLLDELSTLYRERVGDIESAFRCVAKAVVLAPEDNERRALLENLGAQSNQVSEVIETLISGVEGAEPHLRPILNKRIAELQDEHRSDAAQSIFYYERALEDDDSNLSILVSLEQLYRRSSDYEKLALNLFAQSELCEPERRIELFSQLGNLEDEILNRPDRAIDAYQEWLNIDPHAPEALDRLEGLFQINERWTELADVLSRKADGDVGILQKLAAVREVKLDDKAGAIDVYNQILSSDGTNRQALNELERLYSGAEQWPELSDVLRTQLQTCDPTETQSIEMKLADVLSERLFETNESILLYRNVLKAEPAHAGAINALEKHSRDDEALELVKDELLAHYSINEMWEKKIEILARLEANEYDVESKVDYLLESGKIWQTHLSSPEAALDSYSKAWALNSTRSDAHDLIVSVASQNGLWVRLSEIYEEAVLHLNEPEEIVSMRTRLGDLYWDQLDDVRVAEEHFEAALAVDSQHLASYQILESMFRDQKRFHDLLQLLQRKYEAFGINDPDVGMKVLHQIAVIQHETTNEKTEAIETFERILAIEPRDERAVEAIEILLSEQERWADLNEHYIRTIDYAETDEERVGLKTKMAMVMSDSLEDHASAIGIYRDILDLDWQNKDAELALTGFMERGEQSVQAASLLEPIYRQNPAPEKLVAVLRAQISDDVFENALRYKEIAQIQERELDDSEAAIESLTKVFELMPEDIDIRAKLERLVQKTQAWSGLSFAFENALKNNFEMTDPTRADILFEHAKVLEERLEQFEDATEQLEAVLVISPDDEKTFDALDRLYSKTQNYVALSDLYERRVEVSNGPERNRWRIQLANLYEEVLDDPNNAIACYEAILSQFPSDIAATRSMERLLSQAKRWSDLADLYREQVSNADSSDDADDARYKLAKVLESELDQFDEAMEIYRDIVRKNRDHFGARRSLEGMLRDMSMDDDARLERISILDLLVEIAHPNEHLKVARWLEEKISLIDDVEEKVVIYNRIAAFTEESDRVDEKIQAMLALANAYLNDPTPLGLEARINKIAVETDTWDRLIPLYLSGLEKTNEPEFQEKLLVSVAGIYSGPMNDQDSAVSAYQQVLQIAPNNIHAVQHLEALYSSLELWNPLVNILEGRVATVFEVDEQERVLKRIARIYDDVLEDLDCATHTYQRLLEIDPGNQEYSSALERIFEETEQWNELDDLLRAKALQVDSDAGRSAAYKRIARIQRDMLMDDVAAIDAFRMVTELEPDNEDALNSLIHLYERTEQWPDLLQALNTQKDFAADLNAITNIELRMADVLSEKLSSSFDALEMYKSVLSRDSKAVDARSGMVSLLKSPDTRQEASLFLEQIYRENSEWNLIQELFEKDLSTLEDPSERLKTFGKLAKLLEEELENPSMAFMTLGRALRESPGDKDIWENIDRLSKWLENTDECIAIFEDCVESPIDDPEIVRMLHTKLGKLYYNLQENGEAARHLTAALEIDTFDENALRLLDEVHQREQSWGPLSEVLERRVSITEGEKQIELRYRLGYVKEAVFDEREEALEQYRIILSEDSKHTEAINGLERLSKDPSLVIEICEILEPVFVQEDNTDRLVELLIAKHEGLEHDIDQAENYERIASLNLDVLDNPHVGYAYLSRSFRVDPTNLDVQSRIEGLVDSMDMHEEQVALYEEVVQDLDDVSRANALRLVSAQTMHHKLDDLPGAWDIYHRVLDDDEENEVALSGMENIARQRGDTNALTMVLEQQTASFYDPELRRKSFLQLGALKESNEDFPGAIEAYRQAHLIDENDIAGLNSLIELFEIVEDYPALVDHLGKLADIQNLPDERYATLKRCGRCAHVLLKDPRVAIDSFRQAAEIQPDSREALSALYELYSETEDWINCRDALRDLIALAPSQEEKTRLRFAAAELDAGVLENPGSAIEEYQLVIASEPRNEKAFDSLVALLTHEARWDELHAFYQNAVQNTPAEDSTRLINLQVQLSEISARYLGDEEGAMRYLNSILEVDPTHPKALHVLANLYIQNGRFEEAIEMLNRKLNDGQDATSQVPSMMLRAGLYEKELDLPREAAADYSRILEIEPTHTEAMTALKLIYLEAQAFENVYGLVEFQTAYCEDTEAKSALFMEMAEIAETKLNDPAKYVFALENAYALTPNELSVVERLVNAYIKVDQSDRAEPLVDGLIVQLKEQRRMKDVVRFLHLQGRLAEQRGDEDAAWNSFDAAHKVDASYLPNLLSLGKLLYRRQTWDDALKIFQTLQLQLMNISEAETKVDVFYHLGMIRWYQSDHRRAKDMFRRALGIDPGHLASLESLQKLG